MHTNTDAYTCTHLDSDAKTNPTVSNSTVLVIVCLGLRRIWTDSTVCRESAWDLEGQHSVPGVCLGLRRIWTESENSPYC